MHVGGLGRGERGGRGGRQCFVEPIEVLQRLGPRGEAARMVRREGEQHVEPVLSLGMALARHLDLGEVEIGVGQLRMNGNRLPRRRRLVVAAERMQQVGARLLYASP